VVASDINVESMLGTATASAAQSGFDCRGLNCAQHAFTRLPPQRHPNKIAVGHAQGGRAWYLSTHCWGCMPFQGTSNATLKFVLPVVVTTRAPTAGTDAGLVKTTMDNVSDS